MNVMITSAGRRTTLVKAFQDAVHDKGGVVYAADTDPLAPSLYIADRAIATPSLSDPEYIDRLLDLVGEHSINLLVPTIDIELMLLALKAPLFIERGCRPLISSQEFIRITADKWLTTNFFSEKGVRTPQSWLPEHVDDYRLPEKLFIKPREGSASRSAFGVDKKALKAAIALVKRPIIQEMMLSPEITIDAFIDFDGVPIHYVPRLRLKTIGGESVQGITISDETLREWLVNVMEISAAAGARGPITLQAFLTEDGPYISELNPRFGGGFPLADAAGGHYPLWLVKIVSGEKIAPQLGEYRRGLCMTRYYMEHFTETPLKGWEESE